MPKVSNPVSAYSVFMREYRVQHPGEKFNMSVIGEIWKELDGHEKEAYERKFREEKSKYEEYQAHMLSIDPNFGHRHNASRHYFFPLHRTKAIMKQDGSYAASTESVTAMSRAAECFGEYLLEEVKKSTEGKKRVELSDLFEAINNNQSSLWFLNCLVDEHNAERGAPSKAPVEGRKSQAKEMATELEKEGKEMYKTSEKKVKGKSTKELPKGQLRLTDMF